MGLVIFISGSGEVVDMKHALGQKRVVHVGIAEGHVGRVPDRLRTTGLGSCIGLVLYDTAAGVAGLVHVMLPVAPEHATNVWKYADLAVPWLLERVCECGATRTRVRAKLAGGAEMFATAGKPDIMRVGPRNREAVHLALATLGIPIVAADVGGSVGRTIEFDIQTGTLSIRTATRGTYTI